MQYVPVDVISSGDATDSFCALSPAAPPSRTRREPPQFQPRAGVPARAVRARLSSQHPDLNPVRFAYSNPPVLRPGWDPAMLPKRTQSLLPGDAGSVSATEMRVQPVKTRKRRLGGQSPGLSLWSCLHMCQRGE